MGEEEPLGLDEGEVTLIIQMANYALDKLKGWMDPVEYRRVVELQERMLRENSRLVNERLAAAERTKLKPSVDTV